MNPPHSKLHILLFRKEGQTIIEAVVAISVLLMGFLGIFSLLSSSLHSNRVVADNFTATYLASEGIEIVRNILDHNAITGAPWGSSISSGDFEADYASAALSPFADRTLVFNSVTNFYDYSGAGTPTTFKRRIRVNVNGDEITVNSIVSWTSGIAQSSVNLEDHFFNLKQ